MAATARDELTFLGRTNFLFREYALAAPGDVKRQPRPTEVFLAIKAWGAWNGPWVPYIYEPVDVPGAKPEDLNDIIARYRNTTKGPRIVEAALAVPAARWAEPFGQAVPQRKSTLGMALLPS